MGALEEISEHVRTIADKASASVVGIGHRSAVGSGIVTSPGRVLTNAHNIRGEEVGITFGDGRREVGTVKAVDGDADLAVIDVDTGNTPALELADGSGLTVGAPVFAAANPGGRGLRVTFGLVSGVERSFRGPRGRTIRGAVEHTAPLLPGSSGGPLLDGDGRVLGINTNRLGEGFYQAIPADESLRSAIESLGRGEVAQRPRLGVGIAPPQVARGLRRAVGLPEADGLLVRYIEDESPAAAAGLKEGDLIVEVAGRAASSVDDLHDILESAASALDVKVLRGIEERTVQVELGAAQ